jgi:hypothetical protein
MRHPELPRDWISGCGSFAGGGELSFAEDEVSCIEVAGVGQIMLPGIERKSKTGDEAEDDEGDDEVEKVRVLLFAFHRNLHVKELA